MQNHLKLVLASDYSEAVKTTEHYAIKMALKTGSALHFLHAYFVPLISDKPTYEERGMLNDVHESEEKKQKEHIGKMLWGNDVKAEDFKFSSSVIRGEYPQIVLNEAKATGADMLVIGSHGTKGFIEKIFANHAWQTMKEAEIPVLVVPEYALFTGWKNILFATEYRDGEIPAIKYAAGLANMFNAQLHILHIEPKWPSDATEKEKQLQFNNQILAETKTNNIKFYNVQGNDVPSALNNYCETHNIDLMVVCPEKRSVFEKIFDPSTSISKRFSFHSKVPVLAIPDYFKTQMVPFWRLFDLLEEESPE